MIGYREFAPQDIDQIVSLMKVHMNISQYSNEYFRWKFGRILARRNEVVKSMGIIAEDSQKIVGFAAFVPYDDNRGNLIWNVDDVIVHTDYHKRRISKGLMNYGLAHIDNRNESTYLFSSVQAYRGYISLGYKELFNLDYFTMIPSWRGLLHDKGLLAKAAGTIIDAFSGRVTGNMDGLQVVRIDCFPDTIGSDLAVDSCNLALYRDAGFLNWRFIQHPINTYDCFLVRAQEGNVGYVILSRANLMDFAACDEKYYRDIFAFSNSYFREKGVQVANLFLHASGNILAMVRKAGYRKWNWKWRPFGFYKRHILLLRPPMGKDGFSRGVYSNWFFRMSDINCGF